MHTLSTHHVGKTFAATVGTLYVLCALAYGIVPSFTKASFVYMMHGLNVEGLFTPIQFIPTLIGLVVTVIYSYIAGVLFAWLWNTFMK